MIDRSALVQNSLPTEAPDFCSTPFWYINGLEKSVKIGVQSFNYIDYLEAWCHKDCYTYRPLEHLDAISSKIEQAFARANSRSETLKKKEALGIKPKTRKKVK